MAMRPRATVMLCSSTGCAASHSGAIYEAMTAEIERRGMQNELRLVKAGCRGFCSMGPVMDVYPGGILYVRVKPGDAAEIVEETLLKGRVIDRLCYRDPVSRKTISVCDKIPFYAKQQRVVLRNCGRLDPCNIEEYIAFGGYEALARALYTMKPEEIIQDVKASGLRGRGGAGCLTGDKWECTRQAKGDIRYVVVNGPGAFMDRTIIESDPHSLLEGFVIGGYAIGAHEGFVYMRDEYPLALQRLQIAVDQARAYGFVGKDILGTGFDFEVKIARGAGAFVCGESSALLQSLEGDVVEPRPKHVHATDAGLFDRPTCLNNVKTWAAVPHIINNGPEWFRRMGSEGSPGTMVFSLAGKVHNTGLIEVPMGIKLRDLIYDIGGGPPKGRTFKAVQIGGPSGGFIPGSMLDLPVDFDRLNEAGAMMGSGGLVVLDDRTCMVDTARHFLEFLKDESCGKCTPCREGTKRMFDILSRMCSGEAGQGDLDMLEQLATTVQKASLCGLGKSAPNPVLSTLRYFREEYEQHITEKFCPAGVCRQLIAYQIIAEKCKGCGLCAKACPRESIIGAPKQRHTIDQAKCIQCGSCFQACRLDAIEVIRKAAARTNGNGHGDAAAATQEGTPQVRAA